MDSVNNRPNHQENAIKVFCEPWTLIEDAAENALTLKVLVTALLFILLLPILMLSVPIYAIHKHFLSTGSPEASSGSSSAHIDPNNSSSRQISASNELEGPSRSGSPITFEQSSNTQTSTVTPISLNTEEELSPEIKSIKAFWDTLLQTYGGSHFQVQECKNLLLAKDLTEEEALDLLSNWMLSPETPHFDRIVDLNLAHPHIDRFYFTEIFSSLEVLELHSEAPAVEYINFLAAFPKLTHLFFGSCSRDFSYNIVDNYRNVTIQYMHSANNGTQVERPETVEDSSATQTPTVTSISLNTEEELSPGIKSIKTFWDRLLYLYGSKAELQTSNLLLVKDLTEEEALKHLSDWIDSPETPYFDKIEELNLAHAHIDRIYFPEKFASLEHVRLHSEAPIVENTESLTRLPNLEYLTFTQCSTDFEFNLEDSNSVVNVQYVPKQS